MSFPKVFFPDFSLRLRFRLPKHVVESSGPENVQVERDHTWTRVLAFRTETTMTKPEIRQILEKLYGFEVEKVHTSIRRGKTYYLRYGRMGQLMATPKKLKTSPFKVAYVRLTEHIRLPKSPLLALQEMGEKAPASLLPVNTDSSAAS
ncbi:hypothetical protein Gasu2_57450 [Galdieria sulphuraria]|uniref:Large ribosomal subunit protein uL23m n=1 Tax=Galdieria sulphuraria TaxID=130081 RepID=M2X1B3_GALSU|nr:mitochondrial ribosomal protein L23 precursor [Galdieria sulphuraria]EME30155.1 mitochondrial ribosomal protein L23 precursor [Galdieria sulphuraria]GJD11616.1 hypothetical protein Gasu2_57450 [Galdieria sulphuraria]|eukprot:XP_005706675.1 mitochondrial ribosomal protein L23 precursor [Galdieria sulphuraria]